MKRIDRMTEALAAFVGSVIGVAIGTFAVLHCGRTYEEKKALERQERKAAMLRNPSNVVSSEVERSPYGRKP